MKQKLQNREFYLPLGLTILLVSLGVWSLLTTEKPPVKIKSPKSFVSQQILTKPLSPFSPSQTEEQETNLEEISTLTPQPEILGRQTFKVSKIIDGDTIQIDSGQIVRYIGIDAPESKSCYAKEATEKNIELLLGKDVALEKDVSEVDRYGRLLRYVYVDETFINELLVREGFAKAYPYPPDVKYKEIFGETQKEARESNRGLWGECASQELAQNTPQTPRTSPIEGDKDCSDFKTQAEAQAFFLSQGGPEKDPHRLDQDRDGQACETLP